MQNYDQTIKQYKYCIESNLASISSKKINLFNFISHLKQFRKLAIFCVESIGNLFVDGFKVIIELEKSNIRIANLEHRINKLEEYVKRVGGNLD